MTDELNFKDDEPNESTTRPKFSHLRTHFVGKSVHLLKNSINDTKQIIIDGITATLKCPFKEYIFLDKEKEGTYTLYLGFKYDFEAYKLLTTHPELRLPGKESGEYVPIKLDPTEVFNHLIEKNKENLQKEVDTYGKNESNLYDIKRIPRPGIKKSSPEPYRARHSDVSS